MPLLTSGQFQAIDSDGNPIASGKVYTYEAGTSTPLASYPTHDDAVAQTNANANPTILDSSGRAPIWLKPATAYKAIVKTSADVTEYTTDDITVTEGAISLESKTPSELQVAVYENVAGSYKLTNTQTEYSKDFKVGAGGDVTIEADMINKGESLCHTDGKVDFGAGFVDKATAVASPDSVAGYSRVILNPGASTNYYDFQSMTDGQKLYVWVDTSSYGAIIVNDTPSPTSLDGFICAAYEMTVMIYDSTIGWMPCGI